MNIPTTDFAIGQEVHFKSIHGDFAINGKQATILGYAEHEEKCSSEGKCIFPKRIAICIQFGPEFNLGKTWARIDELFPLP